MLTQSSNKNQSPKSTLNQEAILGCILGTALGDATGLKREGLSRNRAIWLHGNCPSPDLIFRRGFCSDDTEHTVWVACSMLRSGGDVEVFEKYFAAYLRKWLLTLPAGIGLGTLKAIVKSFLFSPKHSGVGSAGNGPAMRSAILGLLATTDEQLTELVRSSTRVTHTDPRAEEGALVIARAARFANRHPNRSPEEFVNQTLKSIQGTELIEHFQAMRDAILEKKTPNEYCDERGWKKGPSGYVNQTVPAAIYCWAYSPNDFREVVTNAVLLGGDTDSVAAIAGAIAGTAVGRSELPEDWVEQLAEWPRDVAYMSNLAADLARQNETLDPQPTSAPSPRWGRTFLRNLVFGVTVLILYFRRFIPIKHRQ